MTVSLPNLRCPTTYQEIRQLLDLVLAGKIMSMAAIAAIEQNLDQYAIDHKLMPASTQDQDFLDTERALSQGRIIRRKSYFIIIQGHHSQPTYWDDFQGWGASATEYVSEAKARKGALRAGLGEKIPLRDE